MYKYFKDAEITPKTVYAGDTVEFTIKLVVNSDFNADKSRIVLDMPAYKGTSRPTLYHQELSGFMEVICSNPDISYEKKVWDIESEEFTSKRGGKTSHLNMGERFFIIDFTGQSFNGDEILIKWGYMCDGYGTGTRIGTIVPLPDFKNSVHIRYFTDCSKGLPDYARSFDGYERPVPDEEIKLEFGVKPREPDKMRFIRRQGKASLLIMDRFYNICETDNCDDYISDSSGFTKNSLGVYETNTAYVVESRKLPLRKTPVFTKAYKDYNIYFGDLHTHSFISVDCIERERMELKPSDYYMFARDVACLDFLAVTDHHIPAGNGRKRISKESWDEINEAADLFNDPGKFAAFTGFEFTCERGDTTVVFNENFNYSDLVNGSIKDIRDIWTAFKGKNYITIPHFHNPGKLPEHKWYECPDQGVEPCLEIFSCHASYERPDVLERNIAEIKKSRIDRNGKYFLDKGYHYGFLCNSDGHKGNPGFNGLTAVYAKELTKDAIMEAIRKRRVYGTTNARIKLLFEINGELMGSILPADSRKQIHILVEGEDRLKAVDLFRNGELYKRFKPDTAIFEEGIVLTEDFSSNWYVRATQCDNHIAYSSPVWFE